MTGKRKMYTFKEKKTLWTQNVFSYLKTTDILSLSAYGLYLPIIAKHFGHLCK